MAELPQRTVGIHLNRFPLPSEVFVTEQARMLRQHRPVILARRIIAATPLAMECKTLRPSKLDWRRCAFALMPRADDWPDMVGLNLIHAHFGPNGLYALPLAERLRIPLFVTFHGYDATSHTSALAFKTGVGGLKYLLGRNRLGRRAHTLIAVSRFIEQRLLMQGFRPDVIQQHYIGVDIDLFTPNLRQERLDIVCVGRMVRAKGQHLLIQAFSKISKKYPEARLRLIGDGADREAFQDLAASLGLTGRVLFDGVLSHSQIAKLLSESAISVSPSIQNFNGAREALGLASLEASASGVPSIVSDCGGLPETVVDGVTGLVTREGDIEALADSIRLLIENDSLRADMGSAGRQHVIQNFNLRTQTEILESLYRNAQEE